MYSFEKVSASEALRLIHNVVAEAEIINKQVAVSIAGPEGELIAFLRMDGASPAASTIAQNKAYTCARDRKSSRAMGEFMRDSERPPAYWGDPGITGFGGGLPIVQGGRVVGGIGISGLSEEEDERIAQGALQAVFG